MATDRIPYAQMKDLDMQLNLEHAIEDEEFAERGEVLPAPKRNSNRHRTNST